MTPLDWGIVLAYAAAVLWIGWLSSSRQKGADEYFRGSKGLPWWAVGISIIATAFSAASLLGGPGEGYTHGFLWLQLQLGDLAGYALVCVLFIPVFVRLDLTSAYEYLESRFDYKTRALGALFFLLFVTVRLGALVYGGALVFATTAGIPIDAAILAVGAVAVLYTAAGGMRAVIWTDVLQFGMVLVGLGAAAAVAVGGVDGGLPAALKTASEAGRLRLFNPVWDPASIRALPTAVLGYGLLAFAVAGTNQQSVQRYVSCKDAASARKAAMLGWGTGLIGVAASLLVGTLLFAYYSARPGRLPEGIAPDQILPHFIATDLPPGFSGLLVAAVFAAAMSSIDSALHALSTSLIVDFYKRLVSPRASEKKVLRAARGLIVFWGAAGIGAAFYVARTGESLLPFLVKYTGYSIGPLLGLFLLGVLVPGAKGGGAFYGALGALAVLAWGVGIRGWALPGIWYPAVTTPLTVLFGWLSSLARGGGASGRGGARAPA